ncbi:oocyte zinc finger protein XlCOF22-like [Stegostoma tigrinum]|uniref:oocyte zinc finger protein XlCOF22-like n=1 Tax=Stegostoma tigrinum TaxID=3053191 RepID=UPI002870646B|nr:oocyte zinc finger protein XlCOF22-like [Stegostoma tigrinum]
MVFNPDKKKMKEYFLNGRMLGSLEEQRNFGVIIHRYLKSAEHSFSQDLKRIYMQKTPTKHHTRLQQNHPGWSCLKCHRILTMEGKSAVCSGEELYMCSVCGRGSSQPAGLPTHTCTGRWVKPWKCGDCGERFRFPSELETHWRTHTGERSFTWSNCGKEFINSSNLFKHRRVHTGEGLFTCSDCGKSFWPADTPMCSN